MKQIQLYGVAHGLEVREAFIMQSDFEVDPPVELESELVRLPKGAVVGVELAPSTSVEHTTHPRTVTFDGQAMKGGHFFAALEHDFSKTDLTVKRIDDDELVRQSNRALREKARLSEISERCYYRDTYMGKGATRQLEFEHIKALRLNTVLREVALFEKIADAKPEAVVLGQAHAERLFHDVALQEALGVVVTKYGIVPEVDREDIGNDYLFGHRPPVLTPIYVDLSTLECSTAAVEESKIRQEAIERVYRAFAYGRVLGSTAPHPDYIGTFNCRIAEQGLFELHIDTIDGKEFKGRVYDYVGDSVVTGQLDENGVVVGFDKQYLLDRSLEQAVRDSIHYDVREHYDGHFGLSYASQQTGGGAYMVRGDISSAKNIIEDCRKVLTW